MDLEPEDPNEFSRWLRTKLSETHDPDWAEELLHQFCGSFESGEAIPLEVLEYLYQGFAKALNQNRPDLALAAALGLSRPAHRPKTVDDRKIAMAAWVEIKKRHGMIRKAAIIEVAQRFAPMTTRTVERALKEYDNIPSLSDEELLGIVGLSKEDWGKAR